MNEVTLAPRGGAGRALTIVGGTLANYEQAFAVARQCAELRATLPARVADLATARIVRATLLPSCEQIYFAWRGLVDMTTENPRQRIAKADAVGMLGFLFDALRRSHKGADAASWLTACTEMITEDAAIAQLIGVKPLPQHPAVLALAIRKIIASAIFPSAPSEIAKAMHEVHSKILLARAEVWPVFKLLSDAERLIFEQDREGWLLPYASGVPSAVASYMLDDQDGEMSAALDALRPDA